jgi:hypothetical protein
MEAHSFQNKPPRQNQIETKDGIFAQTGMWIFDIQRFCCNRAVSEAK